MKSINSFKYQSLGIVLFIAYNVAEEDFYIQAGFIGQLIGLIGAPWIIMHIPCIGLLVKKSWTYHGIMKKSSIFVSAICGLLLLFTLAGIR